MPIVSQVWVPNTSPCAGQRSRERDPGCTRLGCNRLLGLVWSVWPGLAFSSTAGLLKCTFWVRISSLTTALLKSVRPFNVAFVKRAIVPTFIYSKFAIFVELVNWALSNWNSPVIVARGKFTGPLKVARLNAAISPTLLIPLIMNVDQFPLYGVIISQIDYNRIKPTSKRVSLKPMVHRHLLVMRPLLGLWAWRGSILMLHLPMTCARAVLRGQKRNSTCIFCPLDFIISNVIRRVQSIA